MEPLRFSVLINSGSDTTVRIDGLRSEYAIKQSGVFRTLFSLPDSEEAQRVQRGEPILVNLTCYNTDLTLAETLSPDLLDWVFGYFSTGPHHEGRFECSLEEYGHGLQILSFLDISTVRNLTCMVHRPLREIVEAVLPLYQNLSRGLQSSLVADLGTILVRHFHSDCFSLDPTCHAVMFLILNGVGYDLAMESVRQTILDKTRGEFFYRWGDTDIILSCIPAYMSSVENLIFILVDNPKRIVHLGFLFSVRGEEVEPAGVFMLRSQDFNSPQKQDYLFSQRLKNEEWSEPRKVTLTKDPYSAHDTVGSPYLALRPYCITSHNLYWDNVFVERVLKTLGTTLDEIGASY